MLLQTKVFCLVILFCGNFVTVLEALDSDDAGVCVVTLSVRKTRNKLVTINKKCGKKKCVVKKVETYTVPQKQMACCNGWEYDAQDDKCSPICSTGCEGGQCTAPDVCTCPPPSYLDPEHQNSCIQPICNPKCYNADCIANNTCQCKESYLNYNSTHCYNCDEGFFLNTDFSCRPICNQSCINGDCIGPNECSCYDGYQAKNNFTCEPECDCINATCIAPNNCSCYDGHVKLNDSVCIPKCDSCDGECIGPNVCKCREGYDNVNGECKPICDICVNGYCSEPNICSCNEGFVKNGDACVKDCQQVQRAVAET